MFPPVNEQMDVIKYGAVEIIPEDELVQKIERSIKTNKPLRIKLGADPTRPDLHLGHAVVLQKLRQFQDLGHIAVLIIGDFTGMIGDPTGRNKTREPLTLEQARENGKSYLEQATIILSQERLEVLHNSDWLGKMTFKEVIELSAKYTVAQLLERDDFSKRYNSGIPISIHELLYPLAQAQDSVIVRADVELGGTDQKFNLLVGREIQKMNNMEPQCILTMPILPGTDGVLKMSKSYSNYIALKEDPNDMFGKTMSIPDELITTYYQLVLFADKEELEKIENGLKNATIHPRDCKADLARRIVARYYNEQEARKAMEHFDKVIKNKEIPDEIDTYYFDSPITELMIQDILVSSNLCPSKKEAKRMIEQGAVFVDSQKISDPFAKIDLTSPKIFKVGKRKFLKIVHKSNN